MDALLVLAGIAMLAALFVLAGSLARDDVRMRSRWDAAFEPRVARDPSHRRDRGPDVPPLRLQRQ